jgi:hypothetical protein
LKLKDRPKSSNVKDNRRVHLKGTSQFLGGMKRAAKRDAKDIKQANQYKQALKSYPASPQRKVKELGEHFQRIDGALKKMRNNQQKARMERRRRMP